MAQRIEKTAAYGWTGGRSVAVALPEAVRQSHDAAAHAVVLLDRNRPADEGVAAVPLADLHRWRTCDPLSKTPFHKYVPVHIEPLHEAPQAHQEVATEEPAS